MSESVIIALVGSISAILSAIITGAWMWYGIIRKTPREIKVLDTQATVNITSAFKTYAEGLGVIIQSQAAANHALEVRVDELEEGRAERTKKIEDQDRRIEAQDDRIQELTNQIEASDREHVRQIADLQSQNIHLKEKYNRAIEILVKALDNAKIPVPDELSLILGDSISKFKLKAEK